VARELRAVGADRVQQLAGGAKAGPFLIDCLRGGGSGGGDMADGQRKDQQQRSWSVHRIAGAMGRRPRGLRAARTGQMRPWFFRTAWSGAPLALAATKAREATPISSWGAGMWRAGPAAWRQRRQREGTSGRADLSALF